MYAYAANNPVKYTDPDGRKTRNAEVQKLVDSLGSNSNLTVPKSLIDRFVSFGWTHIGDDKDHIAQANEELKLLANDVNTMVDSWKTTKNVKITSVAQKELSEQLDSAIQIYADNMIGAKHSKITERNMNSETVTTKSKDYDIQIYVATTMDPDTGKEGPIFRSFIDINNDGNIDFVIWGHNGAYNED